MIPPTRDQIVNTCKNIIRRLMAKANAQRERYSGKMCDKQFF